MGASLSSRATVTSATASAVPAVDWTGPPRKTNKSTIPVAKVTVADVVKAKSCAPIFIRLAWHDAGKYDKVRLPFFAKWGFVGRIGDESGRRDARRRKKFSIDEKKDSGSTHFFFFLIVKKKISTSTSTLKTKPQSVSAFPARGGANGSLRFKNESAHGANKGLDVALSLLAPVAAKHTDISFADLFQLAGATAVEVTGGPEIPMRYGRKDAPGPQSETPEGNLPAGGAPWPKGAAGPAEHLREIFYRMGLDDKEIVALSGAHTLGRAKPSRSGFGKESTKYTANGPGTPGGSSWCREWLKWDNEYFKNLAEKEKDPELLVLDTDAVLFADPGFRPHAERYAADPKSFDEDYAAAHAKLSELGVEWE